MWLLSRDSLVCVGIPFTERERKKVTILQFVHMEQTVFGRVGKNDVNHLEVNSNYERYILKTLVTFPLIRRGGILPFEQPQVPCNLIL